MESNIYYRFRLGNMQTGLTAEADLCQCAICENARHKKHDNKYFELLAISHKDFTIEPAYLLFMPK